MWEQIFTIYVSEIPHQVLMGYFLTEYGAVEMKNDPAGHTVISVWKSNDQQR